MSLRSRRHGAVLVLALVTLLVVTLIFGATVQSLVRHHRQSRRQADALQAEWLAEAGLARAFAQLAADKDYSGETWQATLDAQSPSDNRPETSGLVTIRVESPARKIIVEAVYPNHEVRRVLARREHVLPATSTDKLGESP